MLRSADSQGRPAADGLQNSGEAPNEFRVGELTWVRSLELRNSPSRSPFACGGPEQDEVNSQNQDGRSKLVCQSLHCRRLRYHPPGTTRLRNTR